MSQPAIILPEAEPLPADVVLSGDLWQRGLLLVDRPFEGGRLTAGLWQSGVFETRTFEFGGTEWFQVMAGTVILDRAGDSTETKAGHVAKVDRGTSLVWKQPDPVLKLFIRWDGDGTVPDLTALWSEMGSMFASMPQT